MWKFSLLVLVLAVGVFGDDITTFALGGRSALHGEFSSACSIDSPFDAHCNGIVVDNRHILTTASCVTNGTVLAHPAWFRVVCGNNNLFETSPGRHVSFVSHLYPHDGYVPASNLNDLAIIRLVNPIQFPSNTIEPAIFSPLPIADGALAQYAGWGQASNAANAVMVTDKRVINAPVVVRTVCNGAAMANPRALDSMVCAGLTAAAGAVAEATCIGNIGGGLYFNDMVVGILAFGTGCGANNAPGVYIQTRLYTAWVNQQLTRTDTVAAGITFPRPT